MELCMCENAVLFVNILSLLTVWCADILAAQHTTNCCNPKNFVVGHERDLYAGLDSKCKCHKYFCL